MTGRYDATTGFTLTELLVVIGIAVLLLAITICIIWITRACRPVIQLTLALLTPIPPLS